MEIDDDSVAPAAAFPDSNLKQSSGEKSVGRAESGSKKRKPESDDAHVENRDGSPPSAKKNKGLPPTSRIPDPSELFIEAGNRSLVWQMLRLSKEWPDAVYCTNPTCTTPVGDGHESDS